MDIILLQKRRGRPPKAELRLCPSVPEIGLITGDERMVFARVIRKLWNYPEDLRAVDPSWRLIDSILFLIKHGVKDRQPII